MPAIPTYESQVTPTVSAPTMEFHDYSGQMVKPKLEFDNSFMLKLIDEQNTAIAQEGQNEMEKYITDLRDGTVDEKTGQRKGGWASLKGANAIKPDADGKGLADRTRESVQKKAEELAANMSPGAAKKFRENYAKGRVEDVYREASGHVLREDMANRQLVYADGVTLAKQRASVATDPTEVKQAYEAVDQAVDRQADFHGWDEKTRQRAKFEAHSDVHSQRLADMVEIAKRSPEAYADALNYLNDHAHEMTAEAQTKARAVINAGMDGYTAQVVAKDVAKEFDNPAALFGKGTALSPKQRQDGGFTSFEGVIQVESGGRQFTTDGNATTFTSEDAKAKQDYDLYKAGKISLQELRKRTMVGKYKDGSMPAEGKRAYGVAQVTVEAAKEVVEKEWGEHWTEEHEALLLTDRVFNERVGRAYYNRLIKMFGGDEDKAIVAYNQGPGTVMEAVKKANSKEGVEAGKTWLDYISDNGREYLTKVRKVVSDRYDGNNQSINVCDSTDYQKFGHTATREEVEKRVLAKDSMANVNPTRLKEITDDAFGKVKQQEEDRITERKNGANDILNHILENGGDTSGITPEMKARVTPSEYAQLLDIARKIQGGDQTGNIILAYKFLADDELLKKQSYDDLKRLCAGVPEKYREMLIAKHTKLNEGARIAENEAALEQRALQEGKTLGKYVPGYEDVNRAIRLAIGSEQFKELSKEEGVKENLTVDFMRAMAQAQQSQNKVFNELERIDFARDYFEKRYNKNSIGMHQLTVSDLSNNSFVDVKRICTVLAKGELEHRGITDREPSDQEILSAFREVVTMRYPQLYGMDKLTLSQERLDYVRGEHKSKMGGVLTPVEELQWYIISIMNNEEVKGEKLKHSRDEMFKFMKEDL